MTKLNFDDCKWERLCRIFGLEYCLSLPLLTEWTDYQTSFNEFELKSLLELREIAHRRGNDLNEDEVKFMLISPITRLANFPILPYTSFTQRFLQAQIGDYELSGKPDFFLATGVQEPMEPFFFLQEYKPAQLRNSDPLGQVLAAMLAAQQLNGEEHNHPIFGAVIVATTWNFVVLQGKQFAVSPAFDVTTDAVFRIPAILRGVNKYVRQWLGLDPLP